jgi:LysR family transcriptional regulator, carnitine catabolism transcriptional activator
MHLSQLELLRTVAECGGYAGASKQLGVVRSAIHRRIRMLEAEVGRRLFEREGRRVNLTKAGQRLLDLDVRIREETGQTLSQIRHLAKDRD